jgi:IS30 family transposase
MIRLKNEDLKRVIDLHKLGVSCREIGQQFGISSQAVSRHLRKHGIETNVGGYCEKRSQIAEKHAHILHLHNAGYSIQGIARTLKMSPSGVRYVVDKAKNEE